MRKSCLLPALLLASSACGTEQLGQLAQAASSLPPGWTEVALDGGGDAFESKFGAATAISENTAFVGMPRREIDGQVAGAVQTFQRDAGGWSFGDWLRRPDAIDDDDFGRALSVTADYLIVGAEAGDIGPGSAWSFPRVAAGWGEPSAIPVPSTLAQQDGRFGLALSLDQATLLVGAPLALGPAAEADVGTVGIYDHDGSEWRQTQFLAPTAQAGALFGMTVLLHGNLAVVGAPGEADGVVYIFERSGTWQQLARLEPPNPGPASFGAALVIVDESLFVGAPDQDNEQGAVHVFAYDSVWQHQQTLVPEEGTVHDFFGSALAASPTRLFVGAPNAYSGPTEDVVAAGSVQIFSLTNNLAYEGMLVPSDGEEGDSFGRNLAAAESDTVVVGATGKAYAFARELSASCNVNLDCTTGYCVEGVCCESDCTDACESCRASDASPQPDGACRPVPAGLDPNNDCDESQDTCGATGTCDGRGACAFEIRTVICAAAHCSETGQAVADRYCDGIGQCASVQEQPCEAGYVCQAGRCATSCSDDTACSTGYYCLDGACVTGAQCTSDGSEVVTAEGTRTPCAPGRCRDGRCLERCERTSDCASELVCHPYRHSCVPPEELVSEAGCSTVGRRPQNHGAWLALLGIVLVRRRRVVVAQNQPLNRDILCEKEGHDP